MRAGSNLLPATIWFMRVAANFISLHFSALLCICRCAKLVQFVIGKEDRTSRRQRSPRTESDNSHVALAHSRPRAALLATGYAACCRTGNDVLYTIAPVPHWCCAVSSWLFRLPDGCCRSDAVHDYDPKQLVGLERYDFLANGRWWHRPPRSDSAARILISRAGSRTISRPLPEAARYLSTRRPCVPGRYCRGRKRR
jgi:hypothetical protein